MAELPVDIINDILSRTPVKSLDRFRCVSKEWCKHIGDPNLAITQMNRAIEEPILVMYKRLYRRHPDPGPTLVTLFRITEDDEAKKESVLEYEWNKPPGKFVENSIGGCCNGLLYLSRYNDFCETAVIHPLRKERYELPPVRAMLSCGLGFDACTNTFKMFVSVIGEIQAMVHVLGTDSWRVIPQISYYKILGDAVFAHGYLHWLGFVKKLPLIPPFPPNPRRKVVRFDVSKEEFGLIDPPSCRITGDDWVEMKLVDLHGEVGLVYMNRHSFIMELWVLKQNNQWVIHCRFSPFSEAIDVVGLWNKSGDILVTADRGKQLFVYSLKAQGFHQVNLVGWEDGCESD